MRHRFAVIDLGTMVHKRAEPCPPWCHLCPHMHGHVMPHCFGSAVNHDDEDDLMHCTCDQSDPVVAHADLIGRTEILINLLRSKRRDRQHDRMTVRRLAELSATMRFSRDKRGLLKAWDEVAGIARRLSSDRREAVEGSFGLVKPESDPLPPEER